MTREEAIHHLYTYSSTNGSGQTTDEQHNEAKRMGIKALEQEPTDKIFSKADVDSIVAAINAHWELIIDEIRAELLDNVCEVDRYQYNYLIPKNLIDRVIDKYKADREALADIYKPTLKADLCIIDEFAFMPQAETEDT